MRPATERPKDGLKFSGVQSTNASAMDSRNARARASLSPRREKVMRGGPISVPSRRKLKRAVALSPSVPPGGRQQATSAGAISRGVWTTGAVAGAAEELPVPMTAMASRNPDQIKDRPDFCAKAGIIDQRISLFPRMRQV